MSSLLHRYLYSLLSLWSALWLIVECKKDFRWCNRHLPQQGRWVDAPPYWFPYDCPDTRIFDQNSTLHCMKGRTLYVIGNSIARQQAFALLELIGGTAVNRQGQRDMCPKHETFWGDSCHSDFNGVKFKYLFMQFLDGYNYTDRGGFPFVDRSKYVSTHLPNTPGEDNPMYWEEDNCMHTATRDCLHNFFSNATSEDVLIFVAGMPYCGLGFGGAVFNKPWFQNSAAAFRAHIAASFPGHVFRLNNAHVVGKKYAAYQPCIDETNQILEELWFMGSESKPWYAIDQKAINAGRDHLYNDPLHFVGPLTVASLTQILNMVCPDDGVVDESHAFSYIGAIIKDHGIHEVRYVVAPSGELRPIPSTCNKVFQSKDEIVLKETIIANIKKGEALPAEFCNVDRLYQLTNDRTVYVLLADGELHAFQSGGAFLSRGYSFESVNKIENWLMNYFKKGDGLY